jgi:DNA modification methylase
MRIELSKLKHHPFNSKVYKLSNIESLKQSISNVGLLEPLVINKKNQVISGNRRLEALKDLEIIKVDVIVKELNKEDEPLHIISHNSQRIKTSRELLNEIKVLSKYYKKKQGYRSDLTSLDTKRGRWKDIVGQELCISTDKIYKLLFIDEIFPELIDLIDNGKMTINQSYIEAKRKKIFENTFTTNNKISKKLNILSSRFYIHNKSSENMVELKDKSINMIMTSPPYYSLRDYGNKNQIGLEKTIEHYLNNLMKIFNECYRVLKNDGSCWVVIGDTYIDGCLQSIPHRFSLKMMNQKWVQRNCITWHKTNPKPESVKNRLGRSNEFIFFFTKSKNNYFFDVDSIREPYKTQKPLDIRSPRHHSIKKSHQIHTSIVQNQLGKVPLDFIESAKQSHGIGKQLGIENLEHVGVYPKNICYLPIKSSSKLDDIILDPFSGSGTTGVVSLELGRKFIGYEINSNYSQLSISRLNEEIKGFN